MAYEQETLEPTEPLGLLPDGLVRSLIRHSYDLVVRKLPKTVKEANPQVNINE